MASAPGEGWANVVRKEAAAEPKGRFSGLRSSAGLKTVVVDANALIGRGVKLYGIADQFVTVQEVLDEVRDPATRFHLATLPVSITCLEPTDEALAFVTKFARATGDLPALSSVDLKVMALAYSLESQMHGTSHLHSEPPPLVVTRSAGNKGRDMPGWGTTDNAEEWQGIDEESSSGANPGSRILSVKPLDLEAPMKSSDGEGMSEAEESDAAKSLVETRPAEGQEPVVSEHLVRASEQEETMTAGDETEGLYDVHQPDSNPNSPREQLPSVNGRPNVAEGLDASKADGEDDGDGWERACCRTTRRNYLKRATKRSAKLQAAQVATAAAELASCSIVEEADYGAEDTGSPVAAGRDGSSVDMDSESGCGDTDSDSSKLAQGSTGSAFKNNETTLAKVDKLDVRLSDDAVQRSSDGVASLTDTGVNDDASSVQSDGVDSESNFMLDSLSQSTVACMTGDFAMQNVLIQIGLRLLSTTGLHIRELNKWVLKCEACNHVASDVARMFCPKCGNGGTLFKVSVTVGQSGRLHAGRPRRVNLRGTKYSLPLPKGGRQGAEQNPVLREDQLPARVLHPRAKKSVGLDVNSADNLMFGLTQGKKAQELSGMRSAASIFGGRRNPNERRRGRS